MEPSDANNPNPPGGGAEVHADTSFAPLPMDAPPAPLVRVERPRRRMSSRALALVGGAAGVGVMACLVAPMVLRRGDEAPADSASSANVVSIAIPTALPTPSATPTSPPTPAPAPTQSAWRVASLSSDPTIQILEGKIGSRPLITALLGVGVPRADAYRILKAFEGKGARFDRLRAKDSFVVAKDRASGRVVAFELSTSPTELWQARENDGRLEGKRVELRVEHVPVAAGVLVEGDLRESLAKAGLEADILKLLDDALEGHAELSDLRRGARLRILATEERIEGAFSRYAQVDAVEYIAARAGATPLRVYWFAREGSKAKGGFYNAKGQQPYQGGWRKPIPLARISSRFNPKRKHPVLHVVMPHNGVDFAAAPGTPVYATASGTVRSVGNGGPCGNMVQLQHPNGLVSGYCHLSRFAAGLHPGQHVEVRQLIGYVGQTGRVTGPHLHFLVKRGDRYIDPLSLKLDGVRVLPPSDREEFARRRQQLDAALDKIALPAPLSGATEPEPGASEETIFEEPP